MCKEKKPMIHQVWIFYIIGGCVERIILAHQTVLGGLVRLVCEFHIQGLINKQPRPSGRDCRFVRSIFLKGFCLASSVRTVLVFCIKNRGKCGQDGVGRIFPDFCVYSRFAVRWCSVRCPISKSMLPIGHYRGFFCRIVLLAVGQFST